MLASLTVRCVRVGSRTRAVRRFAPVRAMSQAPTAAQAALEPAVKIPAGSSGYLLTLAEPNSWWKANAAEEAVAMLRRAWKELNDTPPPEFEPHAILDAPGALFVAQGQATGAKADPVDIVHRLLDDVSEDPITTRKVGEHLTRILPVTNVSGASVDDVERLAHAVLDPRFPSTKSESGETETFAVRAETHSPRIRDSSPGDLVRRVADIVPKSYKVDLSEHTKATVLLMLVGQNAMLSVVDDWHALHKYNLRAVRAEAMSAAD